MKGIVLAGGKGTRLWPLTKHINKHLISIYDKPMIYYSLSILMLANIKEILIISTNEDLPLFEKLLEDGSRLGIKLSYLAQDEPKGVAHSFIIAEDFIAKDNVALTLGDNLLWGAGVGDILEESSQHKKGALIFACWVKDPQRYGVVEFDKREGESSLNVISIEEKPKKPKSNYAVIGLYFYDNKVVEIAKTLKPSQRGELEITDLNNEYLKLKEIKLKVFKRGVAWLDTGTFESLLDASEFIATVEKRQGLKIGCLEEIAYRMGFINKSQLKDITMEMPHNDYRNYLEQLFEL